MDKGKALNYLENSFLHDLLIDEDITDISYNGSEIYYVSNTYGRKKSEISLEPNDAKDFLRQMANLSEKQFSYTSPNLDLSFDRYRINAYHQSIGRVDNEERVTFSLRIASKKLKIADDDTFMNPALLSLLKALILSKESLLISGPTGSGKTELQKYLISLMEENTRVIVIDNVSELENVRPYAKVDLTSWLADDKNENADVNVLVKNALRSNPDWLIVAEARGKEMNEVLNSALTGVPIITTLHSFDIYSIPNRVTSMVMMAPSHQNESEVIRNVYYHFHFYLYLKKKINEKGEVIRYISDIAEVSEEGEFRLVYQNNLEQMSTQTLSPKALSRLDKRAMTPLFRKTFTEEKYA